MQLKTTVDYILDRSKAPIAVVNILRTELRNLLFKSVTKGSQSYLETADKVVDKWANHLSKKELHDLHSEIRRCRM